MLLLSFPSLVCNAQVISEAPVIDFLQINIPGMVGARPEKCALAEFVVGRVLCRP